MTLSRTFPLIGGVLLTVLLAGCAGNAQTPANEEPAAAKAGTDDGHGHAAGSKEAKAETTKAPADADEGVVQLTRSRSRPPVSKWSRSVAVAVVPRACPAGSNRRSVHAPRWRRP